MLWTRSVEVEAGSRARMTYRGLPSDAGARLTFFDLGPVQLELVQPVGEGSAWQEGLDRNGESLHHLAFWTENMPAAAAGLGHHGAELVEQVGGTESSSGQSSGASGLSPWRKNAKVSTPARATAPRSASILTSAGSS